MKFRTIILIVFIIFGVVGVAFFAFFESGGGGDASRETVVVWGTVSSSNVSAWLRSINDERADSLEVIYQEKNPDLFENELVNAIASGRGPDIIFFPDEYIIKHADKLVKIPFENFTEREFKDTFVEGGEIFLSKSGILGLPVYVDPIVMYWNRDIFSSHGLVREPDTWDEVLDLVPVLTQKDESFNVFRSAISMGEYANIQNAKEILLMLFTQVGNPLVTRGDDKFESVFFANPNNSSANSSVLSFYTEFANPSNSATYNWNRSLPNSKERFLAGDLAMYIGFSSEATKLKTQNPNLNFDIATIPQLANFDKKRTYAELGSLAVLRTSPRIEDALRAVYDLTATDAMRRWSEVTGLPSVRRDVLVGQIKAGDIDPVFSESAVVARGFLDPDSTITDQIFSDMIQEVTSGLSSPVDSLNRADNRLKRLIENVSI